MAHVPDTVKKAVKGELREPQLAELAQHFFQVAGGPRGVAKMLYDEYQSAPPGGIVRSRILDLILRATKFANEQTGPRDDMGLLTDEDVERHLAETLRDVTGGEEGEQPG